ncbi:MAG: hypothetical protein IT385_00485 [Deltaproteobacteria bacterium]|nr:hypothetical protein [Deltaproteobacteria bacterium]
MLRPFGPRLKPARVDHASPRRAVDLFKSARRDYPPAVVSEEVPREPAPKKRRRRRRKPSAPAAGAPVAEVARTGSEPATTLTHIVSALDRVVAALARDAGLDLRAGHAIELALPLELGGLPRPLAERARALEQALRRLVDETARGARAFRDGHVYCFFSDQPESPYSSPPGPTDVFAGYAPNGKPDWIGFANLCLVRREPRVDRLFADSPEIAAIVQMHDELAEGLLPEFGHDNRFYRLVGQVSFGLVPRTFDLRDRAVERVALTLQVVATTLDTTATRLRLNVLGATPTAIAEAAAAAGETSAAEAFRKVVRATRDRVDALGRRAALAARSHQALDLDGQVRALLTRLRGDLLRVFKSRDHRTRHAEERHESGERPTSLAISDALGASEGRFFHDDRKDTVVVAGPRHRVHVFSRDGRHVTSLEVLPGELERRVERGRWRPLEKLQSELFKRRIAREPSA